MAQSSGEGAANDAAVSTNGTAPDDGYETRLSEAQDAVDRAKAKLARAKEDVDAAKAAVADAEADLAAVKNKEQ